MLMKLFLTVFANAEHIVQLELLPVTGTKLYDSDPLPWSCLYYHYCRTITIATQDLVHQNFFSSSMEQNNFLFLCKTATHREADGESSSDIGSHQTFLGFTNGGISSKRPPLQQNR